MKIIWKYQKFLLYLYRESYLKNIAPVAQSVRASDS